MQTSATASSFLHLLWSRKESAIDDDLLRQIFEVRAPHDTELAGSGIQWEVDDKTLHITKSMEVLGWEFDKKLILSELLDSNIDQIQLSVIPIVGISGIGKTTLAQLVYEEEVVKKHFEVRAWVKVAGREIRLQHIAQEILKSATGISCPLDDLEDLDEMVRDTLKSQICLFVFDEIHSMGEGSWLHMNQKWFNVVGLGSKVLITSRSYDVGKIMGRKPIELRGLSEHAGWSLCRHLAFDSSEGVKNPLTSPMAENLAALCQGSPLLLKLVGSLMRHEKEFYDMLCSTNLSDGKSMPFADASIVVLLSIWALPRHLRQCLAYCATFPHGYALDKEKIIKMWIAVGLVKKTSPGNNNLEDIGSAYFHQLLCRSFFMDITRNEYGDIVEFQIPGLIHDIAKDAARIIFKKKIGVVGSVSEDAGHLSLLLPSARKYYAGHLETLILSSLIEFDDIQVQSLLEFKYLKSLDLSCCRIQSLSDDVCALKELRYLNLSCTLIERLPDSITRLSRLETLDVSWCYRLKQLPKQMCKLTHLRHLDLLLCESLSSLPSQIGLLRSLNSMPLFVLGKDDDCGHLGELKRLNQLRGRLEIRNLENARGIREAKDAKLDQKNLYHLGLSWSCNCDNCFKILEYLRPNEQLKVLELTGYMGTEFPTWMPCMSSLTKISINDCGCKELPSLGALKFLVELQLRGMMNIENIGPEFYGYGSVDVFLSLEQLGLYDMPRLSRWSLPKVSAKGSVFRSLKTLTIEGCPQLEGLPSLRALSSLIIWNSNSEILDSLTSLWSLTSLLIKEMEFPPLQMKYLSRLSSFKKLMLFNLKDFAYLPNIEEFRTLEHLGILHCSNITIIDLYHLHLPSLRKLHIIECEKLVCIMLGRIHTAAAELVIEDCPLLLHLYSDEMLTLHSLRKLIINRCPTLYISEYQFKMLEKLEYLFINECPRLEMELEMEPSLISHVPCVILGNHKLEQSTTLRKVSRVSSPESEWFLLTGTKGEKTKSHTVADESIEFELLK
ncbi:UNVERIFIED_CONTAM: putative disease resistance RPP13-like protein 1 [Sesamum radiatum]|uniref:Disease resistance RPP13-like protein 1 n=1 Tax=Sesamum radiatum TaxID=300843 RepID=A0AAW2UC30_SESRA